MTDVSVPCLCCIRRTSTYIFSTVLKALIVFKITNPNILKICGPSLNAMSISEKQPL